MPRALPRPQCRGLIEARPCSRGQREACANLFRGLSAAASLKLRAFSPILRGSSLLFRGLSAAASLKPPGGRAVDHDSDDLFRGLSAAASLKR